MGMHELLNEVPGPSRHGCPGFLSWGLRLWKTLLLLAGGCPRSTQSRASVCIAQATACHDREHRRHHSGYPKSKTREHRSTSALSCV
eukprot:3589041-Rhodomonas_salina.1